MDSREGSGTRGRRSECQGDAPITLETRQVSRESRDWLDPWTGVTILGLDWALFSTNLLSGMMLTPLVIVMGTLAGFIATFFIERRRAGRSIGRALVAAGLAAIVVGAPMPLGGTIVGGMVLALSGLPRRHG